MARFSQNWCDGIRTNEVCHRTIDSPARLAHLADWNPISGQTFRPRGAGRLLDADAWDGQMYFLVQHGYRCVALDRRGHGRSSQASAHNDMNDYADDLAGRHASIEWPLA